MSQSLFEPSVGGNNGRLNEDGSTNSLLERKSLMFLDPRALATPSPGLCEGALTRLHGSHTWLCTFACIVARGIDLATMRH